MQTLIRDLRIGLRVLIKEKSFCALAVIVLALGISGVTTMFSVVNGVMLRGFDFPNASRLVSVNFVDPTSATAFGVNGQLSGMDFQEFQPAQQSYDLMASYLSGSTVNVTANGQPRRYTGAYVTENFLRILGVTPIKGRDIAATDNVPNGEKVALIGYGLWQRDFNGADDIVGKAVRINGKPATIIGVMPKGFAFPQNEELWLPLYSEFPVRARNDPNQNFGAIVALIKPGVTLDSANAEASTFAKRFAAAYPDTNKQFNAGQVVPLLEAFTPRPLRGTLWTMFGFCVGVLFIACANVMNMQFARATLRSKELAVRSSLGASRSRLLRQMLTESLLLSSIGAAVGIVLAYGATNWLQATVRNLDTPPPSYISFDVDTMALVITVGATVLAAVLSGLLPAYMSSRTNAVTVLRDAGRGNTSWLMSLATRSLVVFQVVVTCVLLIGSLLQVRSILKQQTIDYGYDTTGVMSARMGLMDGAYPSPEARRVFFDHLVEELKRNPEYEAVALTNRFRMVFSNNGPVEIDGKTYAQEKDRPIANGEQVTPGFFQVLGQHVLEGRSFEDADSDTRMPIAVVNAAFAHKHYGNESALGRRFRTGGGNGIQPGPWRTVVGVVSNVRMAPPFNIPNVDASGYYVPFYSPLIGPLQTSPAASQFATVVVRPRGGRQAVDLAPIVRKDVQHVDADLPLYFVGTPKSQLDGFIGANRIIATMFSIFGMVAVVLAAVGIYGVMSFSVNQRRQEFGVRMALGSPRARILTRILRQGSVQVGIGLALGLGLTYAVASLAGAAIQNVLFDTSAKDPAVYGAVAALVLGVSLIATLVPARRATRVDPMTALRLD